MAAEPDAIRIMRMRPRPAVDVIEFEHARLGATVAELVDESAPALIADIDVPSDGGRHGPRTRACGVRLAIGTRLPTGREALLLHFHDEKVHRRLDDVGEVARWEPVTE